MGSKKLKRKKLKCKRLQKLKKLKTIKRKTSCSSESCKEVLNDDNSQYSPDNRLNRRKYSRSYIGDKYISKVKNFSHIREDYFSYLQKVVKDNCLYYNSIVTEEVLENLSLELEQYALLACLQVDIYEKSMTKIISDIKKCTEEKQMHEEVKKLLPDLTQSRVKTEKPTQSPAGETYSRIPTISNTRTNDNTHINGHEWGEQDAYNGDSFTNQYQGSYESYQNQINGDLHHWDGYSSVDYWSEPPQAVPETEPNSVPDGTQIGNKNADHLPSVTETVDPLLISRNQLQKSVEETLNQCEKVSKQKKDEKERAYIAHILEGDDSLDDNFNDSLSDNENESKENVDESNLMDRLEKMREIFGVEEEENVVVSEKVKPTNKVNSRSKRPTIWRHERVIQLHKFSMLASEMTLERREANRGLFLELFGEDSDEEHELEYCCPEKYRVSCTERISSWVVKYLMPFYHEKRIVGRNVFKSLGHHISDSIIDEIQYPDEWTVKYFVSKFFPPRKKYISDADILAFQLE